MSEQFYHIIQNWLLPPGLIIGLLLISLALSFKALRVSKLILIFSILFFWMISTPYFAALLYAPLEKSYQPLDYENRRPINDAAIVVLAAGAESDNTYKRLRYAAFLSKKINVPIILSGGNKVNGRTEAETMRDDLRTDFQITSLDYENTSHTTKEESKNLLPILQRHSVKQIFLVTQAYHMPRSLYAFNKTFDHRGIEVIPAPADYRIILSNDPIANLLPQINAFNESVTILHEYLGLIWYAFTMQKPSV